MKHNKFFIIFIFILLCGSLKAQINFSYDAAGNCILKYKTVVIQSAPQISTNNDEENEETDSAAVDNSENINLLPAAVEDIVGDIEIIIYPNPTKGVLIVKLLNIKTQTPVHYTLMHTNGKHIVSGKSADNPFTLDLSGFSTGVYLLRLTIDEKSEIYKIIKQ